MIHFSFKDCSFFTCYFYFIIYILKIFLVSYSAKTPLASMVGTGRLPSLTPTSCVISVSMVVQPESRRWHWWELTRSWPTPSRGALSVSPWPVLDSWIWPSFMLPVKPGMEVKHHCQLYESTNQKNYCGFINICGYQFFVDWMITTDSMLCLFVANGLRNTIWC